ncbi:MAG: preprotein translocase subunit SecA [Candidatus Omnitrophica bacterium]|nr:preprotein translocase subunit SecA [Candidatus Omnitrophota bacterium]
MFDFIIRKGVIKKARNHIESFDPELNIHIPDDLPLPSVGEIRKKCEMVSRVNSFESKIQDLSDTELREMTGSFKERYRRGIQEMQKEYFDIVDRMRKTLDYQEKQDIGIEQEKIKEEYLKVKKKILDGLIPEVFAVVREAGKRVLSMRHYDVQLLGGIILNEGNIAEMITGEGKTLVATLPAYLNALTEEGVHIVTVNDYLARRDCEWMGPIYEFLGLTIGVIQSNMDFSTRREAYQCDITYGTNNEFGFDYLRDNMVISKNDMVQRPHHFAIVDEVDSILIDEARTPLIISGPAEEATDIYYKAREVANKLKGRRITERDEIDAKHQEIDLYEGYDYLADEKNKSISLSEDGEDKAAEYFGIDNMHEMRTIEYRHQIMQALKAKEFFKKDIDYVVKDAEVIIVDEFTGRMMPGRRWSDGLHQAVEAREGIKIERENQTLATITFQNYFRLYEKLSGMTGTAYTEASEFKEIYDLDCVVMPTNKKLKRDNFPDSIYRSLREKYDAVIEEIEDCYQRGQPVLVGTISIEKSELLASLLKQKGIPHQVLNAKYHELEANIISQAGRYKAVTIATNMAGRGTDIVLGGNADFLAKQLVQQKKQKEDISEEDEAALVSKFIDQFRQKVSDEHEKVIAEGGLHVLGTERHESRRIDNQLRGRQGRQGDPGSSRFFVSLEDDLMRLFGSERIIGIMDKLGMEEGQVLEHPLLSKALENAQRRVEAHNFDIRKHLLEYDNVMNRQREAIYTLRRSILERSDVKSLVLEALDGVAADVVQQYLFTEKDGEQQWDFVGLNEYLRAGFHCDISAQEEKLREMAQPEVIDVVFKELEQQYEKKEQSIPGEHLRHLERMIFLHMIDTKWKDHLYSMDQLKIGIGLRAVAQRDPLVEYKREGYEMFQMMYDTIYQETAELVFKVQPVEGPRQEVRGVFNSIPQNMIHNEVSSLSGREKPSSLDVPPDADVSARPAQSQSVSVHKDKVGRNAVCPCGSGKKYKKCCGK